MVNESAQSCAAWRTALHAQVQTAPVSPLQAPGGADCWVSLPVPDRALRAFPASTRAAARAGTKAQLKQMFDARNVIQFAEFYPVGHRSTNYHKFFNVSEPYAIRFKSGYEPYVLVARKLVPWYDERFRGYGWDKARAARARSCLRLPPRQHGGRTSGPAGPVFCAAHQQVTSAADVTRGETASDSFRQHARQASCWLSHAQTHKGLQTAHHLSAAALPGLLPRAVRCPPAHPGQRCAGDADL